MSRVSRSRGDLDETGRVSLVYEAADDDHSGACTGLLGGDEPVLVVAVRDTPREWLAARRGWLAAGDAPSPQFVATYPHPDCVRVVADPGDLSRLALAAGDALDAFPADAAPAVCVDAVSTLLEYATPVRVGRFLQVLAGRACAAGGTLHCHADADAVTRLPAASLLFDGVVESGP
ncbi:MAG: hypothetical protein ABEJ88_09165 [Halobacterium sp.]